DAIFATRPLAEWAEAFDAEPDLFWSPVNTIEDLIADEQFLAAGSVVQVPDEAGGWSMLAPRPISTARRRRRGGGRPAWASTPARCWPSSTSTTPPSTPWWPTGSRSRERPD